MCSKTIFELENFCLLNQTAINHKLGWSTVPHTQFPFPSPLTAARKQRLGSQKKITLGYYMFPLEIRTLQYERNFLPVASRRTLLIVMLDFQAERHDTTWSNVRYRKKLATKCSTKKHTERNRKKQVTQLAKVSLQKYLFGLAYGSFSIAGTTVFLRALDSCIYHDYIRKKTSPKKRRTKKRTETIAVKKFLFQRLRPTIWCRLTANTKWFWQTHTHKHGSEWGVSHSKATLKRHFRP